MAAFQIGASDRNPIHRHSIERGAIPVRQQILGQDSAHGGFERDLRVPEVPASIQNQGFSVLD
jgi:hypothetical protein